MSTTTIDRSDASLVFRGALAMESQQRASTETYWQLVTHYRRGSDVVTLDVVQSSADLINETAEMIRATHGLYERLVY